MFFLFLRLPLFNNNILEDYFPLIFSNLLVILFFLFFQNSRKKADIAYQNHIARLEARSNSASKNNMSLRLNSRSKPTNGRWKSNWIPTVSTSMHSRPTNCPLPIKWNESWDLMDEAPHRI
jgi:hypothetical protein